ncbi:MAG: TylF/MycF/NovP-related O-methyltransferase [Anaerovoracaceae bacterium]
MQEIFQSEYSEALYYAIKRFYYEDLPFVARDMQNTTEANRIVQWWMEDYNPEYNPYILLKKQAAQEAVEFINRDAANAIIIPIRTWQEKNKFIEYVISQANENPLVVECGVYNGTTINIMAEKRPNAVLYGFDSFEGLPEDWNGYILEEGHFAVTKMPSVQQNVHLIKGWFSETLPVFVTEHENQYIDVLHIDSDIYSSAATALESLKVMIKRGTIIVFDEYFNYPGWKNHEYKAFQEFSQRYMMEYEAMAVGFTQMAFRVK